MKITKNRKEIIEKFDFTASHDILSASKIVKESSKEKFDASIDIAVRLGVDPKQANQMVRGVATLPHGTGKSVSVLAIVTDDKKDEATKAGADYVGFEEYIEKIKKGWTDVDVIVTMPSAMSKLGALGKVLGPRGLMPNPKSGTVTNEIGKAIAEHFHHNNWNVIIHYRNSEKEATELKQKLNSVRENSFEIIKADLDDSASVEVLCKKVLEISPNLKAIINNASTFYPKEISEIEEEDWSALLSSNLKAPMFICKFLGERLKKNRGSIVNITDIYAESGLARYATYAAAKAGLLNMTKSLASELAPEVLVNSVAPGVILWDVGNEPDEEKKEEILKKVPLRRMGSVEDIVMMVDYLVTKNSYMTGRNINVDGGKSLG